MTYEPAVPPGSVAPYPAHPAPHTHGVQADPANPQVDSKSETKETTGKIGVLGAAVGIGSAAIVAALLYSRRKG